MTDPSPDSGAEELPRVDDIEDGSVPFDDDFVARALADAAGVANTHDATIPPAPDLDSLPAPAGTPAVAPAPAASPTPIPATPAEVWPPPPPESFDPTRRPGAAPLPTVPTPSGAPIGGHGTTRIDQRRPKAAATPTASDIDPTARLFRSAPPRHEQVKASRGRGVWSALKTLLRERRRMFLSVIAVALGIGYLSGALTLLHRVGEGLALQAGASDERADLVVEGTVASSGPFQEVRRLVSNSLVPLIASLDGVEVVEPRLESKSTIILGQDREPIVGLGLTERPMGASFPTDPELNPYEFVGPGQPPASGDDVVIDADSAAAGGHSVGDVIAVTSKSSIKSYTLTGVVRLTTGSLPAGSSLALFDEETARELFDLGPDNNAIAIRLADGVEPETVRDQLQSMIGDAAEVVTGDVYAEHRRASFEKSFVLIRALLVGFAGLALVVGSFTVANSMSLLFDHRRRGFAMLRLMGASPGQLTTAAVGESLVSGAIAGVLGMGLGIGIGSGIERMISATGTAIPVAGPLINWWIPVIAIAVGMAITVGTAISPARDAARTPPVVAVIGADSRGTNRSRFADAMRIVRTLLTCALAGLILGWVLGGAVVGAIVAGVGVALALVLIALPRLLGRLVGATTSVLLGTSTALKRLSALRSRQARTRAASTTGALLLATAVVSGLVVIGASFMRSVEGQVGTSVRADLVVDSQTFTNGGLQTALMPELRNVPGVSSVTAWSVGSAFIGNTSARIGGMTGDALLATLDLGFLEPVPTQLTPEDIVVSTTLAERENLTVGSSVMVGFNSGQPATLKVAGVYDSPLSVLLGDAIVDHALLEERVPLSQNPIAFVKLADDAPATVEASVREVAERYGAPAVLKPDELVGERAAYLSGFGRVIQWMLAFSVVLALVGVANTLQLGVNERRRELGLLRAVGGTRKQVLRLVLTEAAALSLVGSLVGSAVGFGAAFASVRALERFGMTSMVVPWPTLVAVTVAALVLSLLCAVAPALAAVRIPALEAIADTDKQRAGRTRRREAATARSGDRPTTVNVAKTVADRPGEVAHEGESTLRCYACGSDPGESATCPVCGADQTTGSIGGPFTPGAPSTGASRFGTTHRDDTSGDVGTTDDVIDAVIESDPTPGAPLTELPLTITDAEIVDDADRAFSTADADPFDDGSVEPPTSSLFGASNTSPNAPHDGAADGAASQTDSANEPPARSASKFGARPTERTTAPAAPLFVPADPDADVEQVGGFAAPLQTPAASAERNRTEPNAASADRAAAQPSRRGVFSAGAVPTVPTPQRTPTPSRSRGEGTSAAPPAYGRTTAPVPNNDGADSPFIAGAVPATVVESSATGGATNAPVDTPPAAPAGRSDDPHRIGAAIARLGASSRIAGSVSFSITGALMAPGEVVDGIVVGRALGLVTTLVSTDRRILVISERGYSPEIEEFALGDTLMVRGRNSDEHASITLIEDEQVITVDQIVDVDLAIELTSTIRTKLG